MSPDAGLLWADEVMSAKRMSRYKIMAAVMAVMAVILLFVINPYGRSIWRRLKGKATVAERLVQYGPAARERLLPDFQSGALAYPPAQAALIGIKDQKVLELWARNEAGPFVRVKRYPIRAASGRLGPKLREGDRQVPEGLYRIEALNPNSRFHLALRVNYPNAFDQRQGQKDCRRDLGSDIMIHGSDVSVGCLAMGDKAIEELFVLVADTGRENTELILTPVDFRTSALPTDAGDLPAWSDELYGQIRQALERFILKPD